MSLAQGNNTPTRPRIEPGSPDPESDALTTRPVRSHNYNNNNNNNNNNDNNNYNNNNNNNDNNNNNNVFIFQRITY